MKLLIFLSLIFSILLLTACGIDGMSPRKRDYSSATEPTDVTSEPITNPNSCYCTYEYRPVCGIKDGNPKTYSNPCAAGCDGLTEVTEGACEE